jgi:large subunit ribosomal protein L35
MGKFKNKMKTNRGAAKRFSKTATGKIKFKHTKLRHILTKKSTATKRKLRHGGYIADVEVHLINQLIPYK